MVIQLAHHSVRKHLISIRRKTPADKQVEAIWRGLSDKVARASIASVCLGYLLHVAQKTSYSLSSERDDYIPLDGKQLTLGYPFTLYAAHNWVRYARAVETSSEPVMSLIIELLDNKYALHLHIHLNRDWGKTGDWHSILSV
ncbi:hypothetical protein F4811DRAFT_122177 [Daldinia bambusicola]|nr:hypothetical protein F4811DRAFT_122177 [Daldinia bambusicola]